MATFVLLFAYAAILNIQIKNVCFCSKSFAFIFYLFTYLQLIIKSKIISELHAWNIYLFLCALPSLTTFFGMMCMPESPKFLMTMGRNDEALKVFRKVYGYNTGKPHDSYPVSFISKQNLVEINVGVIMF